MSRYYQMDLTVKGFDDKRKYDVQDAAEALWDFTDWDSHKDTMSASGRSSLGGGETEDNFAERLAIAIFKANQGPCEVSVNATYLEDLPFDTYSFGKDRYEQLEKDGLLAVDECSDE